MTELDDRLREHYRSTALSAAEVSRIAKAPHLRWLPRRRVVELGVAALLVMALSIGVHGYGTRTERVERTVKEAAMNHVTRLGMEVTTTDIDAIDKQMALLPFAVELPQRLRHGFEVLGARYCTISGKLAAHIKLVDRTTDRQISLFMTRAVDELDHMKQQQRGVDGVNVELWREGGLFYAMAGTDL